ncbi:MAG: Gfo/Idh/MocA family oxidoreductase [Lentisphaeria bacterium]|nr:Gfo/Idh/MocA family oxidoreductase [Lentisphaeria bacterium]
MKWLGLMGCGTVADYGHLPAIRATSGLGLRAVFDPDPDRLRHARETFAVPEAYQDVADFLRADLDAVVITSPAPCHLRNVLDAVARGRHVLCEKPLGMNEDECRTMIRAAAENGVMLFTAFDYRFSPVSLAIRDMVRAGSIGAVRSLRLIYIWNNHGKYSRDASGALVENARRVGRMLEGGPLVDCGVHQIDLARFWLGSEVRDWRVEGAWVDEYEAPDHVYLHMDHADGAHTMVEMSYSYCHTARDPVNLFTYELIGTDGVIRYDRGAKLFEVRSRSGTRTLTFHGEKNFPGMYEAFAQALETGASEVLPTGSDGLVAARISRQATDALIARRAGRTLSHARARKP